MARRDTDGVERVERKRMAADEVSWALRDVNRAAVDVDYALARRVGMRPMDYTAMSGVMQTPGQVTPRGLASQLGISTGSTSELIDRLEHAGHLERRRDHHDRRRVSLHPTEHAVQLVLGELAPLFAGVDDLAREFTADERVVITRYLRGAAQLMRAYRGEMG